MRERLCPFTTIVIATHRHDRSNLTQPFEYGGVTDVARMEDHVDTGERFHCFRTHKTMSVRDDADEFFLCGLLSSHLPYTKSARYAVCIKLTSAREYSLRLDNSRGSSPTLPGSIPRPQFRSKQQA